MFLQRFMHYCLLQTYRLTYLPVVSILASITCQEFHTFSQFLRLRRLCSDDSDFSERSEAMWHFFDAVIVVQVGHHRAQQIDRQLALQTAE